MVRAAIYTRLSRDPDNNFEKCDRQERDCRAQAERIGWDVDRVYTDNSVSAWNRHVRREGWESMLLAIEAGELDAVITWHGDRLMRQPWDLERLLTIADERALLLASVGGMRDLSNPDDRFVLRVEVAHACRSSDDTSRRARRGNRAKAEKGLPRPGLHRSYGFADDHITHRPEEAAVIAECCERLIAGEGFGSIARDLNERGIPTVTGTTWRYGNLRTVLLKPKVAGLATYKREIVGPGCWEPIVDVDTWQAARQVADERAAANGTLGVPRDRKYLLAGIATCGTCSGRLYVQKVRGRVMYTCRNVGCPYTVARKLADVDEYVAGVVVTILSSPNLTALLGAKRPADPRRSERINALKARRRSVVQAFADPDGDAPEELRAILGDIDAQVADLEAAHVEATRGRAVAAALGIDRAGWDGLGLSRQRTLIRELVTVTVLPVRERHGPGFDERYVRVEGLY